MPTQNIYDLVDTWNNAATTFTSIKMNVTDTASNAASLLMDLQVGGVSRARFDKTGSLRFTSDGTSLGINGTNGTIDLISAAVGSSTVLLRITNGVPSLRSDASIGFAATTTVGVNDTILSRRAAANLRLGAADAAAPVAQTLSVQSVVAGTTNTAGANLTITGSQGTGTGAGGSIVFQVAPAGSSGTAQNALATALTIATATQSTSFRIAQTTGYGGGNTASLVFVSSVDAVFGGIISNAQSGEIRFGAFNNGGYYPTFYSNNVERWQINTSGHFLAATDNTYDIGASGASRPRNVYVGNQVVAGGAITGSGSVQMGATGVFSASGRSGLSSPANGIWLMNVNAGGDFDRLQFGGTTSSFPALKRSSTALETKLADDSAYAPHAMQYLDVTDGITAPASATGRARIYVDTADGDLKVIFADGTVKTIVTDT